MRILHYFLGFPPYRTGGLTKFAFDLMNQQILDKHNVMALWPGEMKLFTKTSCIKKRKSINSIENYELINPLPISLDEGIQNFDAYTKPCNPQIFSNFFLSTKPDVIHIHTLMGLPKEFVDMACQLSIRTIFTSHDYFGICPKVTLYRYGQLCDDDQQCKNCIQCNCSALSMKTITVMQSPLYRTLKNTRIVKQLRRKHRADFFSEEQLPDMPPIDIDYAANKYQELRNYYLNIFKKIDLIHFNSTLTEKIYKRYFIPKNSKVISITHKDISDNRTKNKWHPNDKLRITYLSPAKPFKGFTILQRALDELWEEGYHNFQLNIYSPVANPSEYMHITSEGFQTSELSRIMSETDVMVAPSIWYETFGFTVLEALSYGVPVIVSNHIGAKDIINNGGIIIEVKNVKQLKQTIQTLNVEQIRLLKNNIINNVNIKLWSTFVEEIYYLYVSR